MWESPGVTRGGWSGLELTDTLFWIPQLCSPKRSLNVRLVWPILTWEGGIFFMQRLQLIKYMRLSEEQDKLCGILRCSPVLQNV